MARADQSAARAAKRAALLADLADIVLTNGIDALALRPAATRLGTSDRMLLYYFGTKAALVSDVLAHLSARLATRLAEAAIPMGLSPAALIAEAAALLAAPDNRPFLALWTEIQARSLRGDRVYAIVARDIAAGWAEWLTTRTAFPPGIAPEAGAQAMLPIIEALASAPPPRNAAVNLHVMRRLLEAPD